MTGGPIMPRFRVDALEKFLVRTTYYVDAKSKKEAERLCKSGKVSYEDSKTQEGDEEWIETTEVEELPASSENPEKKNFPDLVNCKFCGGEVPLATAHRHGKGWVGDECCWDERLRNGDE
jgi:hypothetical protein